MPRRDNPNFSVELNLLSDGFLDIEDFKRRWAIERVLTELTEELEHIDRAAKTFVPGDTMPDLTGLAHELPVYSDAELLMKGFQVMQSWEAPLMKELAAVAAAGGGDVLEVGFGMGISASFIQEFGVRSHTIIEVNTGVRAFFEKWKSQYPGRDIRMVEGRWEDVADQLPKVDGIFFDTCPLDNSEAVRIERYIDPFISLAASLLRPGGVFTYYTDEMDSFSRAHQRLLLEHFSSFTLSKVDGLKPPPDCHYWWAPSMMVVKATKGAAPSERP